MPFCAQPNDASTEYHSENHTEIDYKDSTHDSPTSERLYDSRCAWLIKEGHKLKAISMINLPNR